MGRPTVPPHFEFIVNPKSFDEAFASIKANTSKSYFTNTGKEFTAEARLVTRGIHAAEKVIIFKRNGKESSRSYSCCWGSRTNCNRTYIDPYSNKV